MLQTNISKSSLFIIIHAGFKAIYSYVVCIDWLIDWLSDWLTDWLTDCFTASWHRKAISAN